MADTCAEGEALHGVQVSDLLLESLQNDIIPEASRASLGIELGERVRVIAAVPLGDVFKRHRVINHVVLEGAEETVFDRLGKSDFCGYSVIEILQDVLSIHTLRGRCQTEKNIRSEVTENRLIAVRRCVMEFVDYDVVVIV